MIQTKRGRPMLDTMDKREEVNDKSQGSYTPTRAFAVDVLQGKECIVCFPARISQFRLKGISACGLTAFNLARILFRIAASCHSSPEALDKIASRETVEVPLWS